MKDKLLELSALCRETVGASCQLNLLKTGKFKMEFPQILNKSHFSPDEDPKYVVQEAIDHIRLHRKPLLPGTPRDGMNPECKYTLKKQL